MALNVKEIVTGITLRGLASLLICCLYTCCWGIQYSLGVCKYCVQRYKKGSQISYNTMNGALNRLPAFGINVYTPRKLRPPFKSSTHCVGISQYKGQEVHCYSDMCASNIYHQCYIVFHKCVALGSGVSSRKDVFALVLCGGKDPHHLL